MKNLFRVSMAFMLMAFVVSCSSDKKTSDKITIQAASVTASDGLDLQAVGEMVKKAKDAESLEQMLNGEAGVNNLDLNEDGDVDYINVESYGEGAARGFSLYVNFSETETQEVASIDIEKGADGSAQVYMTGNDQIYGQNHSYHSHYSATDFILMSYLFSPRYRPYHHSPYGYGYRPAYYHPYHPVSRSSYSSRTTTITKTSTIKKSTAKNPAPARKTKSVSPNKNKSSSKVKATLKNPTTSQKTFQKANPSKAVKTGGFGTKGKASTKSNTKAKSSTKSTTKGKTPVKKKTTPAKKKTPPKKSSSSYKKKSSGSKKRKSDEKWKYDVNPMENSYSTVMSLDGVTYKWETAKYPNEDFSGEPEFGFLAQDVEKVIPTAVYTDSLGNKYVQYSHITAYLVEAFKAGEKSQDSTNRALQADIEKLYEIINLQANQTQN